MNSFDENFGEEQLNEKEILYQVVYLQSFLYKSARNNLAL